MKNHSYRSLFLALLLIIGGSLTMHTLVFSKKKRLHYRHHDNGPMSPAETYVPAGPPVEGTVAALGISRIHLRDSRDRRNTFRCESPGQYKIGERLRETYAPGSPPTLLTVERLAQSQ